MMLGAYLKAFSLSRRRQLLASLTAPFSIESRADRLDLGVFGLSNQPLQLFPRRLSGLCFASFKVIVSKTCNMYNTSRL